MNMELRVCWLYHDIMDLYGDKGNILTLKKRCEERGIEFILDTCGIGETKDFDYYDLIFFGGGADKEQLSIIPDLHSKRENIKSALDNGTFALLICGGYQLFGKYYVEAKGEKIEGLGFYDYYSENGQAMSRCIGNIVVEANLNGHNTKIIGFENHGGQTLGVDKPLGKVIAGYGNSFEGGYEGFFDGNVLGTYIHGPLLPKNPFVADFVIAKALSKRYEGLRVEDLEPIENPFEDKAREAILKRLGLNE